MQIEMKRLSSTRIQPQEQVEAVLAQFGETLKQSCTLEELLRRPKVTYKAVDELAPAQGETEFAFKQELETDIKYAGYIERQNYSLLDDRHIV